MSQPQRRFLVAIVDDEEPIRRALRRLLLAAGLDAVTFASGDELLASIGDHHPDCIVLDVHLPGMNGLEVNERLAEVAPEIPTIIVTGHDEPSTQERALAGKAFAFLLKPIDEKRLLDTITAAALTRGMTPPGMRPVQSSED